MSESKTLGAPELSLSATTNRKWWQRLLLYPTVVGAIIGAIPTGLDYYKAFVYDIDFSTVKHAEEQRRLWIKNFACAQDIIYQQVKTSETSLVKVGACRNGDVLIEVVAPPADRIVEWISLEKLKTASTVSSLSLIGKAHAGAVPNPDPAQSRPARSLKRLAAGATKCQVMQGTTKIIRIVQEGSTCYREVIDVMKGKKTRTPVPCSTSCG
jgi:hypothetical protein